MWPKKIMRSFFKHFITKFNFIMYFCLIEHYTVLKRCENSVKRMTITHIYCILFPCLFRLGIMLVLISMYLDFIYFFVFFFIFLCLRLSEPVIMLNTPSVLPFFQ